MRNARQEIPVMMRYPLLWRQNLLPKMINRTWWLSSRLAATYRRTVARRTRIVAVVGSLGKSTTTHAVSAALGYRLPRSYQLGLGNANYSVGLQILGIRPGSPHMVVEAGIKRPGQMAPIAWMLQPSVVVVTSIKSDHLKNFGTLEVTRSEKAEMVRSLPPSGLAVLNGDDPNVLWMASQTPARVVTFGFEPSNDVRAENITLHWPHGMQFRLCAQGEVRDVSIRLLGRHMVYAALAAAAVALAEGRTLDQVIPALASLPPVPGRLQPVQLQDDTILLRDDGKGTVESLGSALDFLSELAAARRGVVLGEVTPLPGDPGPSFERLGQRTANVASYAVFYGDTPAVHAYCGARRAVASQLIEPSMCPVRSWMQQRHSAGRSSPVMSCS